jgi:hypothetical protein
VSAADKAFATLQAKAAVHGGFTCVRTSAGNIVLSRLGGAWIFDNVEKASAWLSLAIGEVPAS